MSAQELLRGHATSPGSGSASVAVAGGVLVVHGLTVSDPDTVSAALSAQRSGRDLAEWAGAALRVGAMAAAMAATGVDLSDLEQRVAAIGAGTTTAVQSGIDRLSASVQDAAGPGGALAQAAEAQITRLAHGIGALLAEDGPVPARITAAVAQAAQASMVDLRAALAVQASTLASTVGSDRSAIHRAVTAQIAAQSAAIGTQLAELRTAVAAVQAAQAGLHAGQATAAVAPIASAAPGLAYEAAVVHHVSRIALAAGMGGASACGTATGKDGSRTGDATVALTAGQDPVLLVIEAKSRARGVTVDGARRELAAARSNRSAHYALMLAPADRLPTPGVRLQVLSPHDLALAWEPGDPGGDAELTAALLLLRLLATTQHPATGTLDAAALRRATADLAGATAPLADILRHAGTAEAALARLKATATALQADLATRIDAMRTRLG
jgi:hypothetical protein